MNLLALQNAPLTAAASQHLQLPYALAKILIDCEIHFPKFWKWNFGTFCRTAGIFRPFLAVMESIKMSTLVAFWKNESGATAIEYGLIAAGISIAIIAAVNGLGTTLNADFKSVSDQLK
jgi:pilus assembly protein Flp/PilA